MQSFLILSSSFLAVGHQNFAYRNGREETLLRVFLASVPILVFQGRVTIRNDSAFAQKHSGQSN